jgi:hypothetical protein
MTRLWMRIIKKHRIDRQYIAPCAPGEERDVLIALCREADLPAPIWLEKHDREFDRFRRTAFLPDHFIEEVRFERMEIELIEDDAAPRVSKDPRNAF